MNDLQPLMNGITLSEFMKPYTENEELIKNYIRAQAGRKTVLVIAHRLSTVKGVDRIALVQDGQIVAQGPHDELAATNSYYEKVVALQFAA